MKRGSTDGGVGGRGSAECYRETRRRGGGCWDSVKGRGVGMALRVRVGVGVKWGWGGVG